MLLSVMIPATPRILSFVVIPLIKYEEIHLLSHEVILLLSFEVIQLFKLSSDPYIKL